MTARRRKPAPQSAGAPVVLPHRDGASSDIDEIAEEVQPSLEDAHLPEDPAIAATSVETSLTSRASSADDSTRPTTPLSAGAHTLQSSQPKDVKTPSRTHAVPMPIVPAIPNIPFIPKAAKRPSGGSISQPRKSLEPPSADGPAIPLEHSPPGDAQNINDVQTPRINTPPPQKSAPKSWADLVRATVEQRPKASEQSNANGFNTSKPDTLFHALSSYQVDDFKADTKISFLEPRGLVNTGNMCYMNSVSGCRVC